MEDKQIDELLRKCWQPEPPDGMRERVLNRARCELRPRRLFFPRLAFPRWQTVYVGVSLLIILVCGISNTARDARLAKLEDSGSPQAFTQVAQRPLTLGESRLEINKILKDTSADITGAY